MLMPSPIEVVISGLVMAVGCAFQAAFGFGMALLVIPILALIDLRFVPGPVLFAGIVLAAATTYRDRASIHAAALKLPFLGLFIGTFVGALALKQVSGPYLTKVFGGLILLAALISVARSRIYFGPVMLLAGSITAGIMGTMVGVHGPAISLVLQNEEPPKVRAILGAFFTVGYVIAIGSLAFAGLFRGSELVLGLYLCPGVVVGYFSAPAISRFINQSLLRIAIIVISSVSAIVMILK